MILNDTLQNHQDCIEQCEHERVACETEQVGKEICSIEEKVCERNCDFDYGP